MTNEILIPIAVEFRQDPYIQKVRERAAVNAEQMVNIQDRLQSGVIMRFGEEVAMTDGQIERRKEILPLIESSLLWDLETLKSVAVSEIGIHKINAPVSVKIPETYEVGEKSSDRFRDLRYKTRAKVPGR